MARERLTMKETCEVLGVSRQMVQKLEAAGELKATRENGRVLFRLVETLGQQREQRKLDEALDALTKELRELRDAEERRQRDARFSRLLERRPVKSDSEFFEVATALALAASVLLRPYLAPTRPARARRSRRRKRSGLGILRTMRFQTLLAGLMPLSVS